MKEINDKMNIRFKYQKQIDMLLAEGCQLPELFVPNNLSSCRFAFAGEGYVNPIGGQNI